MAVGHHGVPALPHGGSAHVHLIQPARVVFIQEQRVGQVIKARLREHAAQIGRAHKARAQLVPGVFKQAIQRGLEDGRVGLGHQPQEQRQDVRRLGVDGQPALGGAVGLADGGKNLLLQGGVACSVGRVAQDGGSLARQARGVQIEGRGDEIRIGAARAGGREGRVQRQPIGKVESRLPQAMVARLVIDAVNPLHPHLHIVVLLAQQSGIAEELIHRPGDDAARVRPGAGRGALHAKGGHHVRHAAAALALLKGHIAHELGVEGRAAHLVAGGGAEHLRVARPAHALVALRAIGGHIHKVAALPPQGVFAQAVHLVAGGADEGRLLHIGIEHAAHKVMQVDFLPKALQLDIPEAEEGEVRPRPGLLPIADVGKGLPGGAQVIGIEAAVLQDFAIAQGVGMAALGSCAEGDKARDFLPHIQHGFACGRMQHGGGAQRQHGAHRRAHARAQQACIHIGQQARGQSGGQGLGGVPGFAVIDIGKQHGRFAAAPGIVRGDDDLRAVIQRRVQFADQRLRIAEDFLLPLEAKAPLIPAVAQQHGDFIVLRQQVGHIVGLILQPAVVFVAAGGQVFVARLLAVDKGLVQTQAADVQPRGEHPPGQGKALDQLRVGNLPGRGDPLPKPGLLLLGGFKPRARAERRFAVIGGYGDVPGIARARGQRNIGRKAQAVDILPRARIVNHAFIWAVHPHAGGLLALAALAGDLIGKAQGGQIKAQRVRDVIDLHAVYSHGDASLLLRGKGIRAENINVSPIQGDAVGAVLRNCVAAHAQAAHLLPHAQNIPDARIVAPATLIVIPQPFGRAPQAHLRADGMVHIHAHGALPMMAHLHDIALQRVPVHAQQLFAALHAQIAQEQRAHALAGHAQHAGGIVGGVAGKGRIAGIKHIPGRAVDVQMLALAQDMLPAADLRSQRLIAVPGRQAARLADFQHPALGIVQVQRVQRKGLGAILQ